MAHNPNSRCVLASACVDDARACKDETERELMRRSSQINDIVMERASAWIREGMTEREIADYIVSQYAAEGCDAMAFQPIVSFGPHAADPHHEADQTRLKAGDCIVIDMGCRKDRYCSDMTRTFFWRHAGSQVCRHPRSGAGGQRAGRIHDPARREAVRSGQGRPGSHCRRRIWGVLYPPSGTFYRSDGAEQGDVSATADVEARPGMIFSIEPGVYLPDEFGVRVEDLVLVTENGCEILNHVDKHWKSVG